MKYVLYFSSEFFLSRFFIDKFRRNLKIIFTSLSLSSVYLCAMQSVYGMKYIYIYIKLLIVKMSGEYLYFSLSASLNIKKLYNIYVMHSSQYFQSAFHPVSCSPRYLGSRFWCLSDQFSQNLEKLRLSVNLYWQV